MNAMLEQKVISLFFFLFISFLFFFPYSHAIHMMPENCRNVVSPSITIANDTVNTDSDYGLAVIANGTTQTQHKNEHTHKNICRK